MTAKIKLNAASGGGSISIQAPSSSSNNRVISLPDIADGTLLTSQSSLDSTKLSPAITGGKILQVEQGTLTSQTAIGSTSYGDLGLSKAITPQTNSKVLVLVNISAYLQADDNEGYGIKLIRTPSGGSATTLLTSGSKFDVYAYTNFTGEHIEVASRSSWLVLDSSVGGDGSTAITYKIQVAGHTTSSINYSHNNNQSSITLFEIGA